MPSGTTDNIAGSQSGAAASAGGVTSGTASEALIKAAMASSSEAAAQPGAVSGQPGQSTGEAPTSTGAATSGATGQPAQATGQPAATGAHGEAPEHRIQAAVRNARAEFKWAQDLLAAGMKPEDIAAGVDLIKRLRGDTKAFWTQLGTELGMAGPQAETEEDYPEADLVSSDGKQRAFSDGAVLKALEVQQKRILREVNKSIQPLVQFHGEQMDARRQAQLDAEAARIGTAAISEARKLPHFKENEAAIKELMAAIPEETLQLVGPVAAMFIAYNTYLQTKVFPSIQQAAETKTREDYQRKAATVGGVHPGATTGDHQKAELRNVKDLAAHMERMAASQTS